MIDLLQQGAAWLSDQLKAYAGRPVDYRRDAQSVSVTATIGKTLFEADDEFHVVKTYESRDFLIQAADLVLNQLVITPRRGDRIEETVGTVTWVYEVMAPGNEPPFRYADTCRKTIRIHTKHVETWTL